jgi:hypothetical protein
MEFVPFDSAIVAQLVAKVGPTGVWTDFTPHWKFWHFLNQLAYGGYISYADLPPIPVPSDYYGGIPYSVLEDDDFGNLTDFRFGSLAAE